MGINFDRRWMAAIVIAALCACAPAPEPTIARTAADGWHDFRGSWNAAGNRRTLSLGADRSATIVELTGSLFLSGDSRPGVGFRGDAIGMGDTATGIVGRAAWTDDRGDRIFSEFRGTGTATGKRIEGTFVGGTGRYAGAAGTYQFTWQYVVETEDGALQGRGVDLTGRVSVVQSPEGSPARAGKP